MKKRVINNGLILVIILILIGGCLTPISYIGSAVDSPIKNQESKFIKNEGTEYWALLVAVGEYADHPQQNRPLMLEEVDDLYELLIQSDEWSEDHIRVLKAEDGTISNIISGLKWLDKMEDEDDISVVFITTHGSPLPLDLPPFDEEDGADEMLSSYWSFAYPTQFLHDDRLNFRLNRLESKGVCLIVDSCYAGGFNDPPDWLGIRDTINQISVQKWIEEFGKDVRGQGRVVLMASREDEVAYSGGFAPYLIDGLRGFADSNSDNVVTAEEAFYYTEPRTSRQHPTMYDGYDGELPLFYLPETKNVNPIKEQKITPRTSITSTINTNFGLENSAVCGFVKDADTSDPLENALVNVRGRDNEWEFFENETTTDSSGFYYMNVPAGRGRMTVYADGYCGSNSGFLEFNENEILWMNFSMYPRPPETSIVCGYITEEETGNPIIGANISLYWEGQQDQFYRNNTGSDHSGFYTMNVAAGEIDLDVDAVGYFRAHKDHIIINDYEILWENFSLLSPPPETAVICGYITDKDTGSPINNARITFEWVDITTGTSYENETFTDSSGFYNINIAPGELYHDIRRSGYDYYNPYRLNAIENEIQWFNVTLEESKIEVDLAKPLRALYINNNRLMPYNKAKIIGKIDIEAYIYEDWWGGVQAEKVEFYIDGELKETLTTEPYIWTWDEIVFGKHMIKVVAYDDEGKSDFKEIEVQKFL